MNPIVTASLIQAGGSLLGGFLGSSGGYNAYDKAQIINPITLRVRDAKKSGIHPLYALGAPTMSPAKSIPGQSPLGSAIADAAQHLGRGIESTSKKEPGKIESLQERALRAQAERDMAAAMKTRSDMMLNVMDSQKAHDQLENQVIEQNFPPSHIQVRDSFTGKLKWVPNPDVYELPELIGGYEHGRAVTQGQIHAPRKRPPLKGQPVTPRGVYDFSNFPVR